MADNTLDGRYVIGIDLGGTNIMSGLVDANHGVVARCKVKTEASKGLQHVVGRMLECIDTLLRDGAVSRGHVAAVGLGAPAAVDAQRGLIIDAVNLDWNNVPLAAQMQKLLNIPVVLDNDVNAGTLAEALLGAARGCGSVLGIFVGTGIGGGIVVNGQLHYGPFHSAGEIGHTIIDASAPIGFRTLEQQASRTAIVAAIARHVEAGRATVLHELTGGQVLNTRSGRLAKAMADDDELVLEVVRRAAELVGMAAANQVSIHGFDCVVVGGGLTEALDSRWMQWVCQAFERTVFPAVCRACRVVPAALGDDAGMLGAAILAQRRLAPMP